MQRQVLFSQFGRTFSISKDGLSGNTAWFDKIPTMYEKPDDKSPQANGVEPKRPDYIVIVEYLQPQSLATLQAPDSGYRLAAQFHYAVPFGLKPVFDFVNSPV